MTIVQLEYIVAVDTCRSFNKAAAKCFVTQPTLSLQIQKLEDLLGVKLFDRNQQPVAPTRIGAEIIEKARLLLIDYKKIQEIAQNEKSELSGELNMGIITTVAPYLIPNIMTRFMGKHPNVKLNIWEETTGQIISHLKSCTIDCGIVSTPLNEGGFLEFTLFTEKFVAYVGDKSPLAARRQLKPADVDAADIWVLNEGHCMRDQVLNICQKKRDEGMHNYDFNTGSLETLRRMVDENNGATILPELALTDFTKEQQKKVRHFKSPEPFRNIGLITAKNLVKRRLIETLKNEIVDFFNTAVGDDR